MTNSLSGAIFEQMILFRFANNKKERRVRVKKADLINDQVRRLIQKADQQLILMVRS